VVENVYFSGNLALVRGVPNQQTALHWELIYGQMKWKVNCWNGFSNVNSMEPEVFSLISYVRKCC